MLWMVVRYKMCSNAWYNVSAWSRSELLNDYRIYSLYNAIHASTDSFYTPHLTCDSTSHFMGFVNFRGNVAFARDSFHEEALSMATNQRKQRDCVYRLLILIKWDRKRNMFYNSVAIIVESIILDVGGPLTGYPQSSSPPPVAISLSVSYYWHV